MIAKEFDHCGQHRKIGQAGTQRVRIKAGQSQKSLCARFLFQNPAKRREYERLRVYPCFIGGC